MSIAILIPTRHRPDGLQPLLDGIHATTATAHRVYFMVEPSDKPTVIALRPLRGDHAVVFGDFGGYPAAINAGYHASDEPYFLCVNDDVRFTEGWDTEALKVMTGDVRCVGVNQGDGRTESFVLVDRRYIVEQSGVFDQPDTVMHPYLSQFCDDEFADLAKQRGVWADAPKSVIEHLHWTFGKSEKDANYEMAQDSYSADKATYERRKAEWAASST